MVPVGRCGSGGSEGTGRVFGDLQLYSGLIAATVAAAMSTIGLLSMAFLGDWGRRNSPYFSAFAVGFLLVAVLFHLVPEALSFSRNAWRWIIVGFAAMGLIGIALRVWTKRSETDANLAFGYASILALGSHSLLDGVIYETTFHDEFFTGGLATFGLLLHEFPEGVIAFFLLREAGMPRYAAGFWAFVAASLTTIIGAIVTTFFLENAMELPFPTLLGLTAGGLFYITIFHLGPHARFTPKGRGYFAASIGVVIALAAVILREASGL